MANLRANPTATILPKGFYRNLLHRTHTSSHTSKSIPQATLANHRKLWLEFGEQCKSAGNCRWFSSDSNICGGRRGALCQRTLACRCSTGEVDLVGEGKAGRSETGHGEDYYLVREFGWGVRRMAKVGEEMRRVAAVQAEAFHVPVALFDDFFFEFFKAEVLSALVYRIRNSQPDRYACLVAESINETDSLRATVDKLVGVVDATIQRDQDVLKHLEGVEEYLYVSGIAVLKKFSYLALRAYEDDSAARKLYSNAGYKVVSTDPQWTTWFGRKRRVLMVKPCALEKTSNIQT